MSSKTLIQIKKAIKTIEEAYEADKNVEKLKNEIENFYKKYKAKH